MHRLSGLGSLPLAAPASVVTVGFFDGVPMVNVSGSASFSAVICSSTFFAVGAGLPSFFSTNVSSEFVYSGTSWISLAAIAW